MCGGALDIAYNSAAWMLRFRLAKSVVAAKRKRFGLGELFYLAPS